MIQTIRKECFMSQFCHLLFFTAIAVTLVSALAPPSPKMQKAISCATGAALLFSLLLPLGEISLSPEGPILPPASEEVYTAAWERGYAEGLRRDLLAQYGETVQKAKISVSLTAENTLARIRLTFPEKDPFADLVGMRDKIARRYGVPCEVAYE